MEKQLGSDCERATSAEAANAEAAVLYKEELVCLQKDMDVSRQPSHAAKSSFKVFKSSLLRHWSWLAT